MRSLGTAANSSCGEPTGVPKVGGSHNGPLPRLCRTTGPDKRDRAEKEGCDRSPLAFASGHLKVFLPVPHSHDPPLPFCLLPGITKPRSSKITFLRCPQSWVPVAL